MAETIKRAWLTDLKDSNTKVAPYTITSQVLNSDGTSFDSNHYTSSEIDDALANKVNVEPGKGLSSNDFTTEEKNKLATVEEHAEMNRLTLSDDNGSISVEPLTTISVVDNLTSYSSTSALSANQGRVLNTRIDNLVVGSGGNAGSSTEVIDARTDTKGVTHSTLKARIDNEVVAINEKFTRLNFYIEDGHLVYEF